jgi:hypothetical protein
VSLSCYSHCRLSSSGLGLCQTKIWDLSSPDPRVPPRAWRRQHTLEAIRRTAAHGDARQMHALLSLVRSSSPVGTRRAAESYLRRAESQHFRRRRGIGVAWQRRPSARLSGLSRASRREDGGEGEMKFLGSLVAGFGGQRRESSGGGDRVKFQHGRCMRALRSCSAMRCFACPKYVARGWFFVYIEMNFGCLRFCSGCWSA